MKRKQTNIIRSNESRPHHAVVPSEAAKDPITRILAAALNPAFPAERLRMLVPEGTVLEWVAKMIFDREKAVLQADLPAVTRRGKIEIRAKDSKGERTGKILQSSPYALLEDIIATTTPLLAKHGFSIGHKTETMEGKVRVQSFLAGYGHREYTDAIWPHDSTGSKNINQAIMSSISYGKRANICSLLNIATKGEDDDANSTGKPLVVGETVNSEQIQNLKDMLEASNCPEPHLLQHLNKTRPDGHPEIAAILDLPAERYDFVVECLRMYEANRKKKEAEKTEAQQSARQA